MAPGRICSVRHTNASMPAERRARVLALAADGIDYEKAGCKRESRAKSRACRAGALLADVLIPSLHPAAGASEPGAWAPTSSTTAAKMKAIHAAGAMRARRVEVLVAAGL